MPQQVQIIDALIN